MNRSLLTLWNTVPSGKIKQEKIAETIGFSIKQTKRYLQKWSEEGWLEIHAGKGRGNSSTLRWLKDVESCYEEAVMEILEKESAEISSKYLMYEWSVEARQRLMNKFQNKFGFEQAMNDKLIVPRKYPFLSLHPLTTADASSANMVATIFNRLVAIDKNGTVFPELCHSWDITETRLRLYLKKDITFHDGSSLTAEDVVYCLGKVKNDTQFQQLWDPIEEIKAVTPLIADLIFPRGCSYCLQLLGSMTASIYKEHMDNVYGTGPFYVEENNPTITTLVAFKDYYGERPLLDKIEFVQVPKDFENVYRTPSEKQSFFPISSESGFGIVIINPQLDIEVRHYVHYVISLYRKEVHEVDTRLQPNEEGCLVGISEKYTVERPPCPKFERPLILKLVDYTEQASLWLQDILTSNGIPIELLPVSFADNLNKKGLEVDLTIHGEIFEMNQIFSYFYFLINGYSPLSTILTKEEKYKELLKEYPTTPFDNWARLHKVIDRMLIEDSIICPLYYSKRQIPFSADLMNINIKHFGFVDFSKLWIKPSIG